MNKKFAYLALSSAFLVHITLPVHDLATTFNRANEYFRSRDIDKALIEYRAAYDIAPEHPAIWYNLGLCYKQQNNHTQARAWFEKIIDHDSTHTRALQHLSTICIELKDYDAAIHYLALFEQIDPDNPELYLLQARVARTQERYEDALTYLARAEKSGKHDLSLRFEQAYLNTSLGNTDAAIAIYQDLVTHYPNNVQLIYNLGFTYKMAEQLDDAIACYERALAINPEYEAAQFGLGMAYLMQGRFSEGWKQHELYLRRSKKNGDALRSLLQTEDLNNHTVLLRPEGGLGDTLQFIRLAQNLKQRGATIMATVQKSLVPILRLCPYLDIVIPSGAALPTSYDAHATYMSLPAILNVQEHDMATNIPYLYADDTLIEYWQPYFSSHTNLKVGICWQADVYNDSSRLLAARRGIPLADLYPLFEIPGISWFSLQKMDGVEQLADVPKHYLIHQFDSFDEEHGSFMDTAAIMMHLDLIITVDTAVAHLAGGLGKKVWLFLPYSTDWRWLTGRTDSPWYPTMKIFKQSRAFDWPSVVTRMYDNLVSIVAAS